MTPLTIDSIPISNNVVVAPAQDIRVKLKQILAEQKPRVIITLYGQIKAVLCAKEHDTVESIAQNIGADLSRYHKEGLDTMLVLGLGIPVIPVTEFRQNLGIYLGRAQHGDLSDRFSYTVLQKRSEFPYILVPPLFCIDPTTSFLR